MEYQTYDELIALVAEFRLEHRNLTDDELDKLVKQTFRIDQANTAGVDGVTDLIQSSGRWTGYKTRLITSPHTLLVVALEPQDETLQTNN